MHGRDHPRYTILARNRSVVNRIRRSGGQVDYVSLHSGLISARIPRSQAKKMLRGRDVLLAEEDQGVTIPKPKLSRVLTKREYQQSVKKAQQTLTWNVRRVWRGAPAPDAGRGIRVGVVDSGIDLSHPDLVRNIRGGVNFVHPGRPPRDDNGHGTHVAGIIAARSNGIGVVGVAPSASLYAIKVLNAQGSGSITDLIRGIDWGIDNRMHILNLSLSAGGSAPAALVHAVNTAVRRGILVVAAAGNSGNDEGNGNHVEVPARIASTLAVAATNRQNRRASFSATGPALDLSAPGVDILSTYPVNRYAVFSGTSMACPHVSGVAARFKQGGRSTAAVRRLLFQRAIPLGARRWYGAGLVQV
ncbi:subtilisin [Melghirimyces thermohalophilus]|uniref:Subtilisin n=1 Tax=Melghirimyces thermohalophilus TaxID=1236220 RepID=A0A1G6QHH5_9BACL|nr:S8 family peptidase [Melghirimyces thermohalophilus]SDC91166.1 subtilisin [Melghirimyces thermohalophilus]